MNKVFSWFLQYSGANAIARVFLDNKIFVLNYHSVSSKTNAEQLQAGLYPNLSIDADLFEKHIKLLVRNGHTFIRIKDLLGPDSWRLRRPTIIYFDDGYKDNLINALPILKKYGAPATVFVSTGLIERTHFLWTLKRRYFLRKGGVLPNEIEKAIAELKSLPMAERERRLAEQYGAAGFIFDPADFNVFLNWDDLGALRDAGWEVASHSVSHSNLLELAPEELGAELAESKGKIEEELKIKVVSFSYPYGRWNPGVNGALEAAGYKIAVSIGAGLNDNKILNKLPMCLKTVPVKITDTTYELGSKLYSRYFFRL